MKEVMITAVASRADFREMVRKVFPDAPERCLGCSALGTAACRIIVQDEVIKDAKAGLEEPEKPFYVFGPDTPTLFAIGVLEMRERSSRELAQSLWEQCAKGTLEQSGPDMHSRSELNENGVVLVGCGSDNPAAFLAPFYYSRAE